MQQRDELARVKARIRALAEKTVSNGCTEAEAMAAAEMVGRLLERYALTMQEVDVRTTACVQVFVSAGRRQRRPIDGCVMAIARYCDCNVWLARDEAGITYVFFGFDTDAALARYLFEVIDRAMATEITAFLPAPGADVRRARASFQHGMAARVAERLEAMHAEREAAVAAQRSTGTALILARHRAVESAFRETKVRLVSVRRLQPVRLRSAFQAGRQAGERVNLKRPVGGGAQTLLS
jgi:hypothetical protein